MNVLAPRLSVIIRGYTQSGRKTKATARFTETGVLCNPLTIAKSSMWGWGRWQTSEKVSCTFGHLWWVSTAGHGGYILVSQVKDLPEFKEPACVCDSGHYYGGAPCFFQVFEFEEDCDWAILEYRDALVFNHSLRRINGNRLRANNPLLTAEEYRKGIVDTLRQYNKGFLDERDR